MYKIIGNIFKEILIVLEFGQGRICTRVVVFLFQWENQKILNKNINKIIKLKSNIKCVLNCRKIGFRNNKESP